MLTLSGCLQLHDALKVHYQVCYMYSTHLLSSCEVAAGQWLRRQTSVML